MSDTDSVFVAEPQPVGLGSAGGKLWDSIAGKYELRADEVRVLEDASRMADVIQALREAATGEPMMVKGSMGQPVLNPLLAEQKTHQVALAGLLRQLKLPDEGGLAVPAAGERSSAARNAANARWSTKRGA